MTYLLAGAGLVLLVWALAWIGIEARASAVVRWVRRILAVLLLAAVLALLAYGLFRPALLPGLLLVPLLFPWKRRRGGAAGAGRGAGWGGAGWGGGGRAGGGMSLAEAAEILGVAIDADSETIKAAHRTLMAKNHPDKGGSPWFARQLNQARDTLLAAREHGS